MNDQDKIEVAELSMRALDLILDEYGPEARLTGATLIFEVETTDEDGDIVYHGNYRSLDRCTASHVGGMAQTVANLLLHH